jgi:hypothetical protein
MVVLLQQGKTYIINQHTSFYLATSPQNPGGLGGIDQEIEKKRKEKSHYEAFKL